MKLGDTFIEDTFAEAFRMVYARLLITAHDKHWLEAALRELTGYSSSVIGCDAETGIEKMLDVTATPDGRLGASVLVFGFSEKAIGKALVNRVGQCVMTCPTTAVFDGLPAAETRTGLGKNIRFFGDGFQRSKLLEGRRYWRIPVMDGEFLVEDRVGIEKGVAGGNVIIQSVDMPTGLAAVRRAVEAVSGCGGIIAPFPGGVARSGSKVGSRYSGLPASTADAYCPTLRGRVETKLYEGVNCVYEIVLDGIDESAVANGMKILLHAAAGEGIVAITAGNYGGKLGKFHFHLRELV